MVRRHVLSSLCVERCAQSHLESFPFHMWGVLELEIPDGGYAAAREVRKLMRPSLFHLVARSVHEAHFSSLAHTSSFKSKC